LHSSGRLHVVHSWLGVISGHLHLLHRNGGLGSEWGWNSEFLKPAMSLDTFLATQVLAVTAVILLVFVSVSVIYLSAVEWRDRKRRKISSGTSR